MKTKEIAKRLKEARIAAGYETARLFIEKYNLLQSTYSLHETGQRAIGTQAAIAYSQHLDIDLNWLLTGEGQGPLTKKVLPAQAKQKATGAPQDTQRLSEEDLKKMTLITQTKHCDMAVKPIDYDLLSLITREVMKLYNQDSTHSNEIAQAISGIYKNIEETTNDDAGKRLLIKPLINAYQIGITKPETPDGDLKVSNL